MHHGVVVTISIVDPPHFDADPDADPDSTYHPEADPDSAITLMRILILIFFSMMQIRIRLFILMRIRIQILALKNPQTLEKVLKYAHIPHILRFWLVICKLIGSGSISGSSFKKFGCGCTME